MKRFVTFLIVLLSLTLTSVLRANASSRWMWHGEFPWVYSYAENSWWYMKAGADGKFLAWKQNNGKWHSFDEASRTWVVLPGQEDVQEEQESGQENQQVPTENNAGDTYTVQGADNLEMIWVDPGTFTMGSPITESGRMQHVEKPHQVTLTQGFWLGKYEVTQAQYEVVMMGNAEGRNAKPSRFSDNLNYPVEGVNWHDVQVFLNRLNAAEQAAGRLPAGMAYQLPTEAQWEYACRAGTTTAYSWGDTITPQNTNYSGSPFGQPRDVGQYEPNPWGFFDMHGNVSEWCADWMDWEFAWNSSGDALTDPVGPASGEQKILRGGNFYWYAQHARSASKGTQPPSSASSPKATTATATSAKRTPPAYAENGRNSKAPANPSSPPAKKTFSKIPKKTAPPFDAPSARIAHGPPGRHAGLTSTS